MDTKTELVDRFHAPGNAEFHLLPITAMTGHLIPVLAEVVTQGVTRGAFTTECLHDVVEPLLSTSGVLLDWDIMKPSPAGLVHHQETLIWTSETPLGAVLGNLNFLTRAEP